MNPPHFIKEKRRGLEHSPEAISQWILNYSEEKIPDYQMSAWLMAVFFRGLSDAELKGLISTMIQSGKTLDFSTFDKPVIDKHSTGGVGDKTSLIIAPLVAACDVIVPMMSGRGLGHTGGTVDKLESIPGFRCDLTLNEIHQQVGEIGVAMVSQSATICPADKKLYALRDVTGTVESIELITASILSKKIAEGLNGLVLDVKYGSGAFLPEEKKAIALAKKMLSTALTYGLKAQVLLTSQHQPLGVFIGNALEVAESLAVLQQRDVLGRKLSDFKNTQELSLKLSASMLQLAGKAKTFNQGYDLAKEALMSGKAFEKWCEICEKQGGNWQNLPLPKTSINVLSHHEGFVTSMQTEEIGLIACDMGAGRLSLEDTIDASVGIEVLAPLGTHIQEGEAIFRVHSTNPLAASKAETLKERLLATVTISLQNSKPPSLIKSIINL